ncbi:MAG: arylesterase [Verrucomicrobia bacterium]|nr:MAG: arylesterase [Verrucomicrobiota bacterium]
MGTRVKQLRTVGALAIALSILCAPTARAAHSDSSTMKTIFVFGDSLSEGFQLKPSQAYPTLLLDKLRAAGLEFQIVNASQSGGTTTRGLARLPPHLKRKIDIFILELGINDAFLGVPIDQIVANLQSIIDQVKARNPNARIIVAGMQLPNYTADDYVSAFGWMYADLAAKNNAALVPYLLEGVGGNPDLNLGDGIHPNAAGQKILAQNVWRVLEPIAREVAAQPAATRL